MDALRADSLPPVPESAEVLRTTILEAIRYAEEGRASHAAWLKHLEAHAKTPCEGCTAEVIETAGSAEVQREWVRKYDVILRALTARAAPLVVEAIAKIADEEERERSKRLARHALRYRSEAHRG